MDLGSKSRAHIIMPMSSTSEEKNLHADQHEQACGGSNMAKGSNVNMNASSNLHLSSFTNPANNNANYNPNHSSNLGSLAHFTSSTTTTPLDNHSHVNARQAEPGNLLKPSAHDIHNTDSNNNNIDDGITNISNNGKNNCKSTSSHGGLRYRECLKNHAANMGGYAVDGCGEFMPSGQEGSLEALKCAACGCHRNFHRREKNGDRTSATVPSNNAALSLLALPSTINTGIPTSTTSTIGDNEYKVEGDHNHSNSTAIPASRAAQTGPNYTAAAHIGALLPHLHHHHHHQYTQHHVWVPQGGKLMHPAGPAGAHHAPGMAHVHHHGAAHAGPGTGAFAYHVGMGLGHTGAGSATHLHVAGAGAGKRYRTKFTMEQREKMFEFSEKVGWRIQKQDEAAVQQFCSEMGVKRHVLKVWMHNNKNTFGKRLLRFPEAFNNTLPESSS